MQILEDDHDVYLLLLVRFDELLFDGCRLGAAAPRKGWCRKGGGGGGGGREMLMVMVGVDTRIPSF